jgi:hypothetical protein
MCRNKRIWVKVGKKNHIKEIYGKKARRRNMWEKMWRMKRENQRERPKKERGRKREGERKRVTVNY